VVSDPPAPVLALLEALAHLQAAIREKGYQLALPNARPVEVEFDIIRQGGDRDVLVEAWVDAPSKDAFGSVWMIRVVLRPRGSWEVTRTVTTVIGGSQPDLKHEFAVAQFANEREIAVALPQLVDEWLATTPPVA
jgi:hypothetical protein